MGVNEGKRGPGRPATGNTPKKGRSVTLDADVIAATEAHVKRHPGTTFSRVVNAALRREFSLDEINEIG